MTDSGSVTKTRALIVRCEWGGWLAVSEEGSALRIGTLGETEEGAKRSFEAALGAWARLLEESASGQSLAGSR